MAENKPGVPFLQVPPEWTPGQPGGYDSLQAWYGRLPAEARAAIPPNLVEAGRAFDPETFGGRWQGLQIQDLRDAPPVWDPTAPAAHFGMEHAASHPGMLKAAEDYRGGYYGADVPEPGGPVSPMAKALGYNDIERAHLLDVLRLAGYDVSGVTGIKK